MPDIIQLLPDHVANQIAAGEVIQRPASAVKELLENAVDAGASHIQLIIRDGGRSLIRVIDNGCGMSETDARMAFARHATSKIRQADDLWAIRTMGFRGEALASIAAVAQVEVRTRQTGEELGVVIEIEGSDVKRQEPVATPVGTSISVKNLFFNVPARRNFLKSNPVETKHIFEEFQRVALAFPGISFSLVNNDQETYRLMPGTFKQRIAGLFGAAWNERIVPVKEETGVVNIHGFIGKPEAARKTRGEQFFFINNRFIKSTYLHHAVQSAFQDLIPADAYPVYFIHFEADPQKIDINIHPTKTEVKFEDEKSVYAILRSAVRKSIGSFSLSPSLDFENEQAFDIPLPPKGGVRPPEIRVNPSYNPFTNPLPASGDSDIYGKSDPGGIRRLSQARWEELAGTPEPGAKQIAPSAISENIDGSATSEKTLPWELHGRYILTQVKSGLMVIDRQGALERILYERFTKNTGHSGRSQQLLFPVSKTFSGPDYELVRGLETEFRSLGFDMEPFGKHTLAINGVPPEVQDSDAGILIDQLLEQFKSTRQQLKLTRLESLAKTLAVNAARHYPRQSGPEQLSALIDQLFACETPVYAPNGRPVVNILTLEELAAKFNN